MGRREATKQKENMRQMRTASSTHYIEEIDGKEVDGDDDLRKKRNISPRFSIFAISLSSDANAQPITP